MHAAPQRGCRYPRVCSCSPPCLCLLDPSKNAPLLMALQAPPGPDCLLLVSAEVLSFFLVLPQVSLHYSHVVTLPRAALTHCEHPILPALHLSPKCHLLPTQPCSPHTQHLSRPSGPSFTPVFELQLVLAFHMAETCLLTASLWPKILCSYPC